MLKTKVPSERVNPDERQLQPLFQRELKAYKFCQKFVKEKAVLDAGCGEGYGSFLLAQTAQSVLGVDISEKAIATARSKYKRGNLTFEIGDLTKLDLKTMFDIIVSLQVIEHIKGYQVYLSNLARVLKKPGVLISSTPNKETSRGENPFHYHEFSASELKETFLEFFRQVQIYGLQGDEEVKEYENKRTKKIQKILRSDLLRIRRFLPRVVLKQLIPYFTFFTTRGIQKAFDITDKNCVIDKNIRAAIDLIAVCKNEA
jgi:2-polyprenyl-3-methyl-5-hydroxy-6-metoxy-1,4-benzoquinol methylase